MHKLLIAILINATALPVHAREIEKLSWLSGVWSQSKAGETVQESWLGPSGKMLVAVNLSTSASGKSAFEYMRIVETPSGLSFFFLPAQVAHQQPNSKRKKFLLLRLLAANKYPPSGSCLRI